MDLDGDGQIFGKELTEQLRKLGKDTSTLNIPLMLAQIDTDSTNSFDKSEFLAFLQTKSEYIMASADSDTNEDDEFSWLWTHAHHILGGQLSMRTKDAIYDEREDIDKALNGILGLVPAFIVLAYILIAVCRSFKDQCALSSYKSKDDKDRRENYQAEQPAPLGQFQAIPSVSYSGSKSGLSENPEGENPNLHAHASKQSESKPIDGLDLVCDIRFEDLMAAYDEL